MSKLLEIPDSSPEFSLRAIKRTVDIAGATTLLLALSPLLALLALLIKLDSAGPVLYRQWRIGLGGYPFNMLKFRTMLHESGEDLEAYLEQDPARRLNWQQYQKLWDDPRLTGLGKWLRRLSLDELPQLWNVLLGEMSLVGPRPILPEQRRIYGEGLSAYLQTRPGLTGLWQVNGRNRTSFSERGQWDLHYVNNWSLWLDLRILIKTIGVVLRCKGAF